MGNKQSINKISFEDVRYLQKNNEKCLIINTLPENEQDCLIKRTVDIVNEVKIINKLIGNQEIQIVIYGKNCNDETTTTKYNSLISLGFINVYIYTGGLFEWLCLQDIYSSDLFPTTSKQLDILKYKPTVTFNKLLITNID